MLVAIALGGVWALCLGTWEPTPRSRTWMLDLQMAIGRALRLQKVGAIVLKMDESQFARDLTKGTLYAGRQAELGDQVERHFLEIRAQRMGCRVIDADMARLLDGMDELIGTKRQMAKMAADEKEAKGAA